MSDKQPPLPLDWEALLAEHRAWLRMVVRARIGDPGAVDEVLQEVALAAVAQRAPLVDPSKVAPWLYRLAVRQVLLYRRKHGRRRRLTERYAADAQPTEADRRSVDPLDWILADERGRLVRTALGQMPPRDAEILLLKYAENWNYHKIAARLGIGHSAVEARLHRARARLRDALTAMHLNEAHA